MGLQTLQKPSHSYGQPSTCSTPGQFGQIVIMVLLLPTTNSHQKVMPYRIQFNLARHAVYRQLYYYLLYYRILTDNKTGGLATKATDYDQLLVYVLHTVLNISGCCKRVAELLSSFIGLALNSWKFFKLFHQTGILSRKVM